MVGRIVHNARCVVLLPRHQDAVPDVLLVETGLQEDGKVFLADSGVRVQPITALSDRRSRDCRVPVAANRQRASRLMIPAVCSQLRVCTCRCAREAKFAGGSVAMVSRSAPAMLSTLRGSQ
jgi:hypothetical protein